MSDQKIFKAAVQTVKQQSKQETGALIARLKSLSAEEFLRLPPKIVERLSLAQYVDIARTIAPDTPPPKVSPAAPESERHSFIWTPKRIYCLAIGLSMTVSIALALIAPEAKRAFSPQSLARSIYAEDWSDCSRLTPQTDGCVYRPTQDLSWEYVAATLQMNIETLRFNNAHLTDTFVPRGARLTVWRNRGTLEH
jgi:hypothetical protein